MSRKTIITGTLILTAANLITKCMGFFNRVYLSNQIGAEGIGLYQLILPIYGLAWSITSAGFTTTISSLTAQEQTRRKKGATFQIVHCAVFLSLLLSCLVAFSLFLFSENIADFLLKDSRTELSLRLLAFSIPFMAVGSCLRGYFIGIQKTGIPALSQVLEQTVRIGTICILSGFLVPLGLSYACLAATAGILFGEMLSCFFVLWQYRRNKQVYPHTLRWISGETFSLILKMSIPLSASRISSSLLSAAENLLIPRQLQLHGHNAAQALATYGELTGMAMPLLFLPSACLTAASVSLVPEISEASAGRQDSRISRTVHSTFLFTSIIGFGAAAVFSVFPREICYIIYDRPALGQVLFPLAFLCPLLYAQTTLHGLLNGLGEQFFLFRNTLLSSTISILIIWFFMPSYGIAAFLCGWALSLIFSVTSALLLLQKRTGILPSFRDCILMPLLSGLAAGLIVKYLIRISEPSKLLFLSALFGMGILYLVFLMISGCLFQIKNDLKFCKKKKSL